MGYELRRLLEQYGVSTPTMAPYTGTSAADAEAYNKYASDYQNRLANTNMYNRSQFSTTGANAPAFTTYSDAQNAVMGAAPMTQASMAPAPVTSIPMVQTPVVSAPTAAVSSSPAPMAGNKPNMKEFMDATGVDFKTASQLLYGVAGSNRDIRDWNAIMSSSDPKRAAQAATSQMYSTGAPLATDPRYYTNGQYTPGATTTGYEVKDVAGSGGPRLQMINNHLTIVDKSGLPLTTLSPENAASFGVTQDLINSAISSGAIQGENVGRFQNAGYQPYDVGNFLKADYASSLGVSPVFGAPTPQNYAAGGSVKGYRPGGPVDMLYGGAGDDEMMGRPAGDRLNTPAPAPVDPMAEMRAMLDLYAPATDYSEQIAAATERRAAEQKAFEDILRSQLQGTDSAPQSKAEMYFRLAAAFGAPTKTGHFAENLGLVGEEMASQLSEKAKREREAREKRLGVDLEIQKARMGAAGEDLEAVQGLQTEEAKYRRDLGKELIKDYIKSGEPQSAAGKTAMDMGLKPGTPEFNAKVTELAQLEIERQTAAINAQIASIDAANKRGTQMTATEIKLRTETEDRLAGVERALKDVAEAYSLNPNSYAGGWLDKGARWLYEVAGSDDPKIINTRRIDNLLGSQALESLKAVFGGAPTEGERAILLELQGIGAKSIEERAEIMERAYEVLQDRQARDTRRLDDILSGAYKTYESITGGE